MKTEPYTKTNGKYKKDNPEATRLRNMKYDPIRSTVYRNAGGQKKYYALPKADRLRIRAVALKEYWDENYLIDISAGVMAYTRPKRKLPKVDRPKSKRVTTIQVDDPRGFVYIFNDHMKREGLYKIGASHEPQARLDQANTWGDFESVYESEEVADCAKLEKEVHQFLRKWNVKGEWFNIPEVLAINKTKEIVNESFNHAVAS